MERLSAQDLMMLRGDDFGWPQEIGVLAILDGVGLFGPDGRLLIEEIRAVVGRRLPLLPRLRQRLHIPRRGLGRPVWVDAAPVDLTAHVRSQPFADDADDAHLLLAVEQLWNQRLDRARPLWQMWVLPGLPGHRIGLLIKAHHTVADGMSGLALLHTLLDQHGDAPTVAVPPRSAPSAHALLWDNVRQRLRATAGGLVALAHPIDALRRARQTWPVLRPYLLGPAAPRTSLNQPIGRDHRIAVVRTQLETTRRIAHAHGTTINDILLTAVTGGLRDLLRHRGEDTHDVTLRAYVPMSLHREEPGQAHGNQISVLHVPLPVGEPDPIRVLMFIAAATSRGKKNRASAQLPIMQSGVVQRAAWRSMGRQRVTNLSVSNVPGPPRRLHLAAAAVLELFPVTTIFGNLTLGVAALSYAGLFTITAVADRGTCPDVDIFTSGIQRTLDALTPPADPPSGS